MRTYAMVLQRSTLASKFDICAGYFRSSDSRGAEKLYTTLIDYCLNIKHTVEKEMSVVSPLDESSAFNLGGDDRLHCLSLEDGIR